jgi:2,4-dienoyl-CoA reductase-like NADH-dependent reductase (Old Yellow Enzyme family)
MMPELIVMLTYNDRTVENALELFDDMKDTPVRHWGFKDVGLPKEETKELVRLMSDAGKTTYLEVVSLSEEEGLEGAELAVASGVDILMGTVFFDSISEFLKDKPVAYYPFLGNVHSHPTVLEGSVDEIVAHAKQLEAKGVDGVDLLTYRHTGAAAGLLTAVVEATSVPIVCAGSIGSYARIDEVLAAKAWGFTVGTALFEEKFVPKGSFRENVTHVWNWMQARLP